MTTRLISNSEVSSWLQCRRKYWYEYVLDLEPKVLSAPLTKGTLVHAMLEGYYVGKSMGLTEEECIAEAMVPLLAEARRPGADIGDLGETKDLVLGYFAHYREVDDERYKVYAVESKMRAELVPDYFAIAGTLDLIWLDTWDGKYIIVDHKTSYNFWTDAQAQITGQPVKYAFMATELGLDIKGAMINQLRTRKLKEGNDLYKRIFIKPSAVKVKNVMNQHIRASTEIMEFRQHLNKDAALPVYDKYACKECNFLDLCDADSEGSNIDFQIKVNYRKRESYGYQVEAPLPEGISQ
jgi:CRISPR/Cas system-associated exonuclease Cas4 (RecB family)